MDLFFYSVQPFELHEQCLTDSLIHIPKKLSIINRLPSDDWLLSPYHVAIIFNMAVTSKTGNLQKARGHDANQRLIIYLSSGKWNKLSL